MDPRLLGLYYQGVKYHLNLKCLAAAGAATLIIGLGGNLQAVPYSTSDTADEKIGASPWNIDRFDCGFADYFREGHAYGANNRFIPFGHLRRIEARYAGKKTRAGWFERSDRGNANAQAQTTAPSIIAPAAAPTRVPDAGSTAILLGGAICGMFAFRKKFHT